MAMMKLTDINIDFSPIPNDESFEGLESGDEFESYWIDRVVEIIEKSCPDFESLNQFADDVDSDENLIRIQITTRTDWLDDGNTDFVGDVQTFLEQKFEGVEISVARNSYDHLTDDDEVLECCEDFDNYKEMEKKGYFSLDLEEKEIKEWFENQD